MKTKLSYQNKSFELELTSRGQDYLMKGLENSLNGSVLVWQPPYFQIEIASEKISGYFFCQGDFVDLHLPIGRFRFQEKKGARAQDSNAVSEGGLNAPMPGKVLKVLVGPNDVVQTGDPLMILEAMKMEHKILSPIDGTVTQLFFQEGDRVGIQQELIQITPDKKTAS